MVLINDKKFACATCIKGHRVSGCTHTDRPLFEIKKKGRPSTQCQCCKDRRKSNSVHNTCICGDDSAAPANPPKSSRASGSTTPLEQVDNVETRKGQPGSSATFPNGLRDVHEINAAVEALTGFAEDPMRSAERSVQHLLNPCSCKHTGICKCCMPKRAQKKATHSHSSSTHSHSSGSRTPDGQSHTEHLVELYKANAPSHSSRSSSPNPSPISPSGLHPTDRSRRTSFQHLPVPDISPGNPHHPAHTSKHVHKTKLYSPYSHSAASRPSHTKRESLSRQGATSPRPSLLPLRPLGDMSTFLGALFRPDGTVATEISRAALGLPGIHTFDEVADQAQVKLEPMDWEETNAAAGSSEDVDMPLAFPTSEEVTIGACTCGEGCRCPGCVTHPNAAEHTDAGGCADAGCKSCFDCTDHLHIPAGMTSIEHLLATAAANVPQPSRARPQGLRPLDISVAPPAAAFSPDAAASSGFVQLKPLECCNGRCQCRPGECVCEKDCCGCCVRCACGEDAPTPTADTFAAPEPPAGGCCSASNPAAAVVEKSSCCETGKPTPRLSLSTDTLAPPSTGANGPNLTPPRLSPASAGGFTFNPSPYHSPLLGPSSSSGGSNHHSPMLAAYHPSQFPSSQSSPLLSAGQISPGFNFEQFQLPSPGLGNGGISPSMILPPAPDVDSFNNNPASLRRSTSISGGHAHSQSTSSTLSNRRATVTAGTGVTIQRSASTGKQASKALALNQPPNHPHVRTIAPKPAALLAPPKSASSSSRGTSPVGRRRSTSSTQHSRASSPGPSPVGVQNGQRYGHSSVDHTNANGFMPIQGLPIVTTSAPDETSQQVSFDPALQEAAGLDDPDITALLNQLAGDMEFGQANGGNQMEGQGGDDGGNLFANDFTFAGSAQHQQQQQQQQPQQQSMQSRQPTQEEMYQLLLQSMATGNSGGFTPQGSNENPNMANGFHFDAHGADLPAYSFGGPSQPGPSTAGQFPSFFPGGQVYNPSFPNNGEAQATPQASSSATLSFPPSLPGPDIQPGRQMADPNLIDLSKPLNAEHLARIITALQIQQAHSPMGGSSPNSATGPMPTPGQIPNPMPPPPVPSHSNRPSADFHTPLVPSQSAPPDNTSFDPSILQKRHQPSFSISSFDSLLVPPPSDSSGSGSGHSAFPSSDGGLMYAGEGEDVFDRYIQDNSGEGLDLSVLDLSHKEGDGGMGMDLGEEAQKGDTGEGMEFGLRMDDWVWTDGGPR